MTGPEAFATEQAFGLVGLALLVLPWKVREQILGSIAIGAWSNR